MKKKKIFSKRNIQSELYNCRFDPNEFITRIIVDIEDPKYWESRAIELIKMAQLGDSTTDYDRTIAKAIQLLILAKIFRRDNQNVQESM